ncbi:hypothetical protein GCM10009668_08440 [Nocardioides dubius]|uniref:Uncharacterized protein n=1 Tax=Nocardioides dubius TaxID=317019 RepID=A0ABN1TN88_9ACTN
MSRIEARTAAASRHPEDGGATSTGALSSVKVAAASWSALGRNRAVARSRAPSSGPWPGSEITSTGTRTEVQAPSAPAIERTVARKRIRGR